MTTRLQKRLLRLLVLALVVLWAWESYGLTVRFWLLHGGAWTVVVLLAAFGTERGFRDDRMWLRFLATGVVLLLLPAGRLFWSNISDGGSNNDYQTDLRCVGEACRLYAADYDGYLPPLDGVPTARAVDGYTSGPASDGLVAAPSGLHLVHFELNPYLRGRRLSDLDRSKQRRTVLAYVCDDGLMPAYKVRGGTWICFADGEVRWVAKGRLRAIWNPWEEDHLPSTATVRERVPWPPDAPGAEELAP